MSLLLLHSLLSGLARQPGGLAGTTTVRVETATLERLHPEWPRLIAHDWRDAEDRRQVVLGWFGVSFPVFEWQELAGRDVPHARELGLAWPDGFATSIRLDQGFGYWRITPGLRCSFGFDRDVDQQIASLRQANFYLEPVSTRYPTYWYGGS